VKSKKLLTMIGSVCLILVLAALLLPACAPKVVEAPELEAKIKALEGELTSEKAEVSKLEKELAAAEAKAAPTPAKVFEWRSGTQQSPTTSEFITMCKMWDELSEVTGGRLKVTQYGAEVLSPGVDTVPSVQKGLYEMAVAFMPYVKGVIPEANCTYIPFALQTYDDLLFVMDPKTGYLDLFQESYEEWGCKLLTIYPDNTSMMMSTKPIYSPADYKGMKIRASGPLANYLDELGASTVYIPGSEVYTALATGTVEAAVWGAEDSLYDWGWHEIAKYLPLPPLQTACNEVDVVVYPPAWDSLPEDLQLILQAVIGKYAPIYYQDQLIGARDARLKMIEEGVTVTAIPVSDYPILAKAAEAVWDDMAALGPKPKQVIKIITDHMRYMGYTDYKID